MRIPRRAVGLWPLTTYSSSASSSLGRLYSESLWLAASDAGVAHVPSFPVALETGRIRTYAEESRTDLKRSPATSSVAPISLMSASLEKEEACTFENESPAIIKNMASVSLTDYLEETIAAVDPSFRMIVTENHRKKMIRCLMGYGGGSQQRIAFEQRLLRSKIKWQAECVRQFVHEKLIPQLSATPTSPFMDNAPDLQAFLENPDALLEHFLPVSLDPDNSIPATKTPFKMFSLLARGRAYKGRFEALLKDMAPQLLPVYEAMVADKSDFELVRRILLQDEGDHQETEDLSISTERRDQILQILDWELPRRIAQPADGGRFNGAKGELDLTTYLQQRRQQQQSNSSTHPRMVLTNVLVKSPQRKHRTWNPNGSSSKRVPYFLESAAQLEYGMTTEFDAMVVEKVPRDIVDTNGNNQQRHGHENDAIRIVELWEAKASVNVMSIADAMVKKTKSLRAVLDDVEARFWFFGDYYYWDGTQSPSTEKQNGNGLLHRQDHPLYHDDTDTLGVAFPALGIFGNELVSPRASARRAQVVGCEARLESCPDAVLEAMETGAVSSPDVVPQLRALLQMSSRLQPLLVVPSAVIQP